PELGDVDGAVPGVGAQPQDLGPELGQGPAVGVADHRHDEPVGGGHGQPDVAIGMDDDLASAALGCQLERGIEDGVPAQPPGDGGDEEGGDGGLDAGGGQPAAGGQQARGVDLVQDREVGDLGP